MSDEEAINAAKAEAEAAKAEATAAKAEAEAIKADKERLEQENLKLKNKDTNFKRLRDMTEAERDLLTEQEIALKKKSEELDDRLAGHEKSVRDDWQNNAIERYARGDEAKAKKIKEALSELSGEATDRPSIEARVAKAAKLAREDAEIDHVGMAFSGFNGAPPEKSEDKSFAETEAGQSLASKLGLRISKKQ
jgi:hypothetical protein